MFKIFFLTLNFKLIKDLLTKTDCMNRLSFVVLICLFVFTARSQVVISSNDSSAPLSLNANLANPSKLISKTNNKLRNLDYDIDKQTKRYFNKLAKAESKLKRRILKRDSSASYTLFSYDPIQQFSNLKEKILTDSSVLSQGFSGQYIPYIDSLQGVLSFLSKVNLTNPDHNALSTDIAHSVGQIQQLQAKMQLAHELKQLMQQRKEQIKRYLLKYTSIPNSLRHEYDNYNKQVYYYSQQIQEYKNMLNDPDKMLTNALKVLNRFPAFNEFMKRNSILASIFGGTNTTVTGNTQNLIGLQTRTIVTANIISQTGGGFNPEQFLRQQVEQAASLINPFADKISQLKNKNADLEMPDYTPNQQHTKKFFQRLEYGANLQSQHSNRYFPITTDMAFSLGYKLNDKSIVGIGVAYKIGWGKDVRHIAVSSEGAGFRSFADIKVKGSFYVSGGFEYNYQQPFTSLQQIKNFNSWAQSGLMGVSKIVSLKSKFLKKSKLQLLWDFLSYTQIPQTQAFKFRIGYSFN